jgi:RNA polymerase sigma-70 factor (ECF subfamily)
MEPDHNPMRLFENWYQAHMTRLYRFIWYQLRDTTAAEDLTASVCEHAYRLLNRYDPTRGSIDAWIFGIARNEIARYRRAAYRSPTQVILDENMASLDAHPELDIQRRERAKEVLASLENLPPRDQEVIALKYGAGLSHTEIATMVGTSENNVAVILHRALQKLKQTLVSAGEYDDGQ